MIGNIYVKVVRDTSKQKNYIFFEHGMLSKPMFILQELQVMNLKKEMESALGEIFDEAVMI